MTGPQLRELRKAGFEIGGHTLDHRRLVDIPLLEAEAQISEGKKRLEDLVGFAVTGFCYPGGKSNRDIRQAILHAGFQYGRTVENFRVDVGRDRLRVPTTLQV